MDLEKLLASAMKQARTGKFEQDKLLRDLTVKRIHDANARGYNNPDNWRDGKVVELILDDGGVLSSLGLFQEQFYRNTPSRRLRPLAVQDGERHDVPQREFVYGRHWVETQVNPFDPEADHEEFIELRNRFEELIIEAERQYGIER